MPRYCAICGRDKANEQSSGKDHESDICTDCQRLQSTVFVPEETESMLDTADNSPAINEQFQAYVQAYEDADKEPLFDLLQRNGLTLPEPESLDDVQLSACLTELIQALALWGVFLHSTDHLSDRELYEELWHDMLREESWLQPGNPDFACHIDLIGSGSEEDIILYLRYYADEDERAQWKQDMPELDLPAREAPPFDRDRHLPKRELWGEA